MKVTLEGQGEPKSIKERQGPLLNSFMYDYLLISGF
jgi:hypothetical protein